MLKKKLVTRKQKVAILYVLYFNFFQEGANLYNKIYLNGICLFKISRLLDDFLAAIFVIFEA